MIQIEFITQKDTTFFPKSKHHLTTVFCAFMDIYSEKKQSNKTNIKKSCKNPQLMNSKNRDYDYHIFYFCESQAFHFKFQLTEKVLDG